VIREIVLTNGKGLAALDAVIFISCQVRRERHKWPGRPARLCFSGHGREHRVTVPVHRSPPTGEVFPSALILA